VFSRFVLTTTTGRAEPEYTLRCVMSSEQTHDEQLTEASRHTINWLIYC